jgi:hypothetical protein
VLAATSVLGDLMEKCPPAEACRDAFERMSKATVQMCMSTPGFGFQVEPRSEAQSHPQPSRQSSMHNTHNQQHSMPQPMQIDSQPSQPTRSRLAPRPIQKKRPPPKFDMDLRELFPEDLEPSTRPSYSFPQPLRGLHADQQRPPTSNAMGLPFLHQQQLSPASNISSQINTGLGMTSPPSLFSQQQQQQSQPQQRSQSSNQSPQIPVQQQQQFYMQNTYNPDFMSNLLPGMDFLNNLSTTPNSGADVDADFAFDTAGGLADLGFGMGLDFQHDWSDGQQYDLFDGFFFGNNTGSGGAGGNGSGGSGGYEGG